MNKNVVVMGASLSAYLSACYLKRQHPDLNIKLIGIRNPKLPIVGESLTEFSTLLFHEIGLDGYLEEEHYHKYGLTFYFKERLNDPADRTYAVHEALQIPPMPANLINRFTLDKHLHTHAQKLGIETIEGKITEIKINPHGAHQVTFQRSAAAAEQIEAQWLVDASGRSRLIGRTLDLPKTDLYARSSFWFRLVDFDREALRNINAIKPMHHNFDSYYVTHHFLGKGNWMWLIPVRTPEYDDMISVGIVWRPDLYPHKIDSVESFQEMVAKEHPVVTEFVASGKVVDTNLYSKYMYDTPHVYSKDRWYIVGDAGDTVDPLYSTGIVMTAMQVKQISEIIEHSKRGSMHPLLIRDLESGYKMIRNTVQMGVHSYYEVMHDSFEAHWRMHLISTFYFFFMLPGWLSGFMSSHTGVRWFQREMSKVRPDYLSLLGLLGPTSKRLGQVPASKLKNWYTLSVDWTLRGATAKDIPASMAKLWFRFVYFRAMIWHLSGYAQPLVQLGALARNLSRAIGLTCYSLLGLHRFKSMQKLFGFALEEEINTVLETSAFCTCGMCEICNKLKMDESFKRSMAYEPINLFEHRLEQSSQTKKAA